MEIEILFVERSKHAGGAERVERTCHEEIKQARGLKSDAVCLAQAC